MVEMVLSRCWVVSVFMVGMLVMLMMVVVVLYCMMVLSRFFMMIWVCWLFSVLIRGRVRMFF